MKPRGPLAALTLAGSLLLFASEARATVLQAIPFDEKVERSEAIVLGRCVNQTARFDESRNWILTTSTFQVEQTMKGSPLQQVSIVTPGGRVGDIAQEVIGVPRFEVGDDHLLFVRASSAGPTVLYLEQGAYRVERNDRGDRMVRPMVASPIVVDTGRGTAATPEATRSLKEFEAAVKTTVREREAHRMKMLEQHKREEASIVNRLRQNAPLVVLALIGALIATWQIVRRW